MQPCAVTSRCQAVPRLRCTGWSHPEKLKWHSASVAACHALKCGPSSDQCLHVWTAGSLLQVSYLPLAVIENQTGGGELWCLALLPTLKAIEATLPWPEQSFLQTVQALHQCRRVFVVGILGGVHGPSEPTDERLGGENVKEGWKGEESSYRVLHE